MEPLNHLLHKEKIFLFVKRNVLGGITFVQWCHEIWCAHGQSIGMTPYPSGVRMNEIILRILK